MEGIFHTLGVVKVQGINQAEKDITGLRQVCQFIQYDSPLQDDPHSGWVELRTFLTNAEDSHWSLTVGVLVSCILTRCLISEKNTIDLNDFFS